jgi:hypothetical protein
MGQPKKKRAAVCGPRARLNIWPCARPNICPCLCLLCLIGFLGLLIAPPPARAADDPLPPVSSTSGQTAGSASGQVSGSVPEAKRSFSGFPILMYDSDIGVGYGGKGKFVNYFGRKESLDLILFNSSKGER